MKKNNLPELLSPAGSPDALDAALAAGADAVYFGAKTLNARHGAENFDDGSWKPIKVGNWETQGFPGYDGFAWYRIAFDAPAKVDCNAVELSFGGVDEEAWVWLNGVYVGQHAVGVSGWDKPFALDVTDELRWGKRNVLVVRVFDARQAGGIWKPIKLDVLR